MLRARLILSGLVQGVGFRSYARNNAKALGLKGYVRNLKSGRLEIIVEGYEKQIDDLLDLLHKGPFGSQVEDIQVIWEDPTNEFKDFTVES
jgi:acylphosphatase